MKHPLNFIGLAALLLTSSCDKHNLLLNERARMEAEIKQGQEDLRVLDAKFTTFGTDFVSALTVIERQSADWLQRNTKLEGELEFLSKKCSDGEGLMNRLRPRIDSYKSKFTR